MNLFTIQLRAGVAHLIGRGRYVRVFDAPGKIQIRTQALGSLANQTAYLIANMGCELNQFEQAELLSETDQTITIAWSELAIYDNRLGASEANTLQVVPPQVSRVISETTVTNAARVKILDANSKRKNAQLAIPGDVLLFDAQAGGAGFAFNGDFEEQANGELWAQAVGADVVCSVMDYHYA